MLVKKAIRLWKRKRASRSYKPSFEILEDRTLPSAGILPGIVREIKPNGPALSGQFSQPRDELAAVFRIDTPSQVQIETISTGSLKIEVSREGDDRPMRIGNDKEDLMALDRGTFRMNISSFGPVHSFQVSVKATPAVSIKTFDSQPIESDPTTWLVVHGWDSSPDRMKGLAAAIDNHQSGDQVLLVDWQDLADARFGEAEKWIEPVADWVADKLVEIGLAGRNLNLVGHSFGSYVVAGIAERIDLEGGRAANADGIVNSIVALAPARDVGDVNDPKDYDPEEKVNFGRNSLHSWAFQSFEFGLIAITGSAITPLTAAESFLVKGTGHGNVDNLFASLLVSNRESPNAVSRYFDLARLSQGALGPWLHDQYRDGYGAIVAADASGDYVERIIYVDRTSQTEVKLVAENGLVALQESHRFHFGGNWWSNWLGLGEKWFLDKAQNWFFLTPFGDLFKWNGDSSNNNTLVANVGTDVHDDPYRLLHAVKTYESNEALRQLQAEQRFYFAGDFYENWLRGPNEKWIKSSDDRWHFLTPDGLLFQWHGGSYATKYLRKSFPGHWPNILAKNT